MESARSTRDASSGLSRAQNRSLARNGEDYVPAIEETGRGWVAESKERRGLAIGTRLPEKSGVFATRHEGRGLGAVDDAMVQGCLSRGLEVCGRLEPYSRATLLRGPRCAGTGGSAMEKRPLSCVEPIGLGLGVDRSPYVRYRTDQPGNPG